MSKATAAKWFGRSISTLRDWGIWWCVLFVIYLPLQFPLFEWAYDISGPSDWKPWAVVGPLCAVNLGVLFVVQGNERLSGGASSVLPIATVMVWFGTAAVVFFNDISRMAEQEPEAFGVLMFLFSGVLVGHSLAFWLLPKPYRQRGRWERVGALERARTDYRQLLAPTLIIFVAVFVAAVFQLTSSLESFREALIILPVGFGWGLGAVRVYEHVVILRHRIDELEVGAPCAEE